MRRCVKKHPVLTKKFSCSNERNESQLLESELQLQRDLNVRRCFEIKERSRQTWTLHCSPMESTINEPARIRILWANNSFFAQQNWLVSGVNLRRHYFLYSAASITRRRRIAIT